MNKVSLTQEQVQQAAASGANLLNDDERVSVPPSMAKSGDYNVLLGVLGALASGQVVLGPPQPQVPPQPPEPPVGDDGGEPPVEE